MKTTTDLNEFLDFIEHSDFDITVRRGVIYDIIGQPLLMFRYVIMKDERFEYIKREAFLASSEVCNVNVEDIVSDSRSPRLVIARWLIAYHLHRKAGFSTSLSGKAIGRDHATVQYGIKQIDKVISNPNCYRDLFYFLQKFENKMEK